MLNNQNVIWKSFFSYILCLYIHSHSVHYCFQLKWHFLHDEPNEPQRNENEPEEKRENVALKVVYTQVVFSAAKSQTPVWWPFICNVDAFLRIATVSQTLWFNATATYYYLSKV